MTEQEKELLQSARTTTQKYIARSFRGILRVSPNANSVDVGFDTSSDHLEYPVSDSVGNLTKFNLGLESASFENLSVKNLNVSGVFNYVKTEANGTTTSSQIDLTAPKENDILVGGSGDTAGQYVKENLLDIIKEELAKYDIFDSIVPIGTVFYVAMSEAKYSTIMGRSANTYDCKYRCILEDDTDFLPSAYKNYAICAGQEVDQKTFKDLYQVVGDSYGTASSGKFKLPDLRNRFIRCASNESHSITNEGTYDINEHKPGSFGSPQTNVGGIVSKAPSDILGTFYEYAHLWSIYNIPAPTGCFAWDGGIKHIGPDAGSGFAGLGYGRKVKLTGNSIWNSLNASTYESRPFFYTLVPIIKISGTNGTSYLV